MHIPLCTVAITSKIRSYDLGDVIIMVILSTLVPSHTMIKHSRVEHLGIQIDGTLSISKETKT
jgi:hypothetical protein